MNFASFVFALVCMTQVELLHGYYIDSVCYQKCSELCKKFSTLTNPTLPRDCLDALNKGFTQSGVYTIKPDHLVPFDVYCDMDTDGGGWTVFQRRQDGSEEFYRGWYYYANGFGNLRQEHWLGLDKLNRLTAGRTKSELRVDMEDFLGGEQFAKYSSFRVENAYSKYTLEVSGYTGTAGDSLAAHNSRPFSTYDQDNDAWSKNCAAEYKGAWWHNSCHHSNLNGKYLHGNHASEGNGVNWRHWKGYHYSLKFTEMKVRAVN